MGNESDWPTLLSDYQSAVKDFESVSAALTAAHSGQYPLGADFMDLIRAEERLRETVILTRMRLLNRWRDSVDGTRPLLLGGSADRTDAR